MLLAALGDGDTPEGFSHPIWSREHGNCSQAVGRAGSLGEQRWILGAEDAGCGQAVRRPPEQAGY